MAEESLKLSRRQFIGFGAAGAATIALKGPLAFAFTTKSSEMSHRQRIEAALAFEETDRLPFGFWWHFPNRDRSPRRLAELALALQQQLDLDFIKFSPYGLYSVVDWGVTLDIRGGLLTPIEETYPIQKPEDWKKLRSFRGDRGRVHDRSRIAANRLVRNERRRTSHPNRLQPPDVGSQDGRSRKTPRASTRDPRSRSRRLGDHHRNHAPLRHPDGDPGRRTACSLPVRRPTKVTSRPRSTKILPKPTTSWFSMPSETGPGSISSIFTATKSCSIRCSTIPSTRSTITTGSSARRSPR